MSNTHDHPKHEGGVQEAQYNIPVALENDGIPGTSSDKGKTVTGNLPSSSAGDDDDKVDSDLLAAWMQRLQVLTILTAFLSSMDGVLFSLTALDTQIGVSISTTARELVYTCLAGALTFHICSTILGYFASFVLIRYRIIEDVTKVGDIISSGPGAAQPAQRLPRRIVCEPVRPLDWLMIFLQQERFQFLSARRRSFLSSVPPSSLLTRCYYTTLCLTAVGFILALTGILAYMWAGLPTPVGIFSTVSLGVSLGASVWAIAM